jgi:hypothetical protein
MGKDPIDIIKAAALSYAGGQAAKAVSGMEGVTDIFGKTGADIASKATGQFVASGGKADPLSILLSQGLSEGTNALTAQIPGFTDLPNYAKTFVNQTVGNTIANKGNLSSDALLNAAISAGMQAVKTASTFGPGDMDQFKEDLIPGYFLPGGEGYIDPMSKTEGVTGSGYYDEITGRYIKDDFGGLQNPLGRDTGNLDLNQKWEYSLVRPGVWANDDGEEIDLSYLPNSEKTLTGYDIMKNAGALPIVPTSTVKKTAVNEKTVPNTNLPSTPSTAGGATQMLQASSQDPYANIKSMEELFGSDISYKLRSLGESPSQKSASSDMDELVRLLRG